MTARLACCRHCGWAIYLVLLADDTELWFDNVHHDMRCLIEPTGLHRPTEHSIAAYNMRVAAYTTAASGR